MKLKQLRENKKMTQKYLAKKLNVSSQTILNWENGIYEPNISQLIELANIFNVSIDYLVERKNINMINDICNELEKISKDDIINFIKSYLEHYKN